MNILRLTLFLLASGSTPIEEASIVPPHRIEYRTEDLSLGDGGRFYLVDETLVTLDRDPYSSCIEVKGIHGKLEGLNLRECFETLGSSLSQAAFFGEGRFTVVATGPGSQVLQFDLRNRQISQLVASDQSWPIVEVEAMGDENLLIVSPGLIFKVDPHGHEHRLGPFLSRPDEIFFHSTAASLGQALLVNTNQGLYHYDREGGETLLSRGSRKDPSRSDGVVVGIVTTAADWFVHKLTVCNAPECEGLSPSVIERRNPPMGAVVARHGLPLGPSWELESLGGSTVLVWSRESNRIFLLWGGAVRTLEVPDNLWEPEAMVLGDAPDRFYLMHEKGFAEIVFQRSAR